MLESLPDYSTVALRIMNLEPPIITVVEDEKQEQILESRLHPETPLFSFINRKDAVFAASPFHLRDSRRLNISVACAKGLISMKVSEPYKQQRLLTKPTGVAQSIALEKKEDLLDKTDAATSIGLSEEANRTMEVLSEAIISVWYI